MLGQTVPIVLEEALRVPSISQREKGWSPSFSSKRVPALSLCGYSGLHRYRAISTVNACFSSEKTSCVRSNVLPAAWLNFTANRCKGYLLEKAYPTPATMLSGRNTREGLSPPYAPLLLRSAQRSPLSTSRRRASRCRRCYRRLVRLLHLPELCLSSPASFAVSASSITRLKPTLDGGSPASDKRQKTEGLSESVFGYVSNPTGLGGLGRG